MIIVPHVRPVFHFALYAGMFFLPERLLVSNRKHFNDVFVRNHVLDLQECQESVTDFKEKYDMSSVIQIAF